MTNSLRIVVSIIIGLMSMYTLGQEDCDELLSKAMLVHSGSISPKESSEILRGVLQKDCNDEILDKSRYNLGIVLNEQNNFKEAKNVLNPRKVKTLDTFFLSYFMMERSASYIGMERYRCARKNLDKAIQMDPRNTTFIYNRGVTNFKLGQYSRASKDFKLARELGLKRFGLDKLFLITDFKLHNYSELDSAISKLKKSELFDPVEDVIVDHIDLLFKSHKNTLTQEEAQKIKELDLKKIDSVIQREMKRTKRKLRKK